MIRLVISARTTVMLLMMPMMRAIIRIVAVSHKVISETKMPWVAIFAVSVMSRNKVTEGQTPSIL